MSDAERFDIGVIGAGSATETLARELDGSGLSMVVFEPRLVGGECPFYACMPSKSMLHDARGGRTWDEAVERREQIVHHRDDASHAEELVSHGVELVRAAAEIVDANTLLADGRRFDVEHLIIATGATAVMPPIEGTDECADEIWTSADALTADELPDSLLVVGAGVIGMECASFFARFGSSVTLIDNAERSFAEAPPAVGELLADSLTALGVDIRYDLEARSIRLGGDRGGVVVTLSDDTEVAADRVLVAIGRRPATTGFGVERLGVDPEQTLPLDSNGRVQTDGSVWALGDVAGQGQYTHLANHHARVVADHLAGSATRTYDDVVVPRCMFTEPPLIQIGDQWIDLHDDADIVEASVDLGSFPRVATDELADGHLWVAARRSTGCVVAATGAGPKFDELTHALVVAIDGAVPVARLCQSMQAFPTLGEILGPVFSDLHQQLAGAA